jgi:hypothetical protein
MLSENRPLWNSESFMGRELHLKFVFTLSGCDFPAVSLHYIESTQKDFSGSILRLLNEIFIHFLKSDSEKKTIFFYSSGITAFWGLTHLAVLSHTRFRPFSHAIWNLPRAIRCFAIASRSWFNETSSSIVTATDGNVRRNVLERLPLVGMDRLGSGIGMTWSGQQQDIGWQIGSKRSEFGEETLVGNCVCTRFNLASTDPERFRVVKIILNSSVHQVESV